MPWSLPWEVFYVTAFFVVGDDVLWLTSFLPSGPGHEWKRWSSFVDSSSLGSELREKMMFGDVAEFNHRHFFFGKI